MSEQEFFNHGNVLVTKSRVVIANSTYPINSISAVHASQNESFPSNSAYEYATNVNICILTIGMIIGIASNQFLIPLLTLAINLCVAFYASTLKTKVFSYHVVFHTSGTNIQAYTSDDKKEIQDIVKAINEAIIARG